MMFIHKQTGEINSREGWILEYLQKKNAESPQDAENLFREDFGTVFLALQDCSQAYHYEKCGDVLAQKGHRKAAESAYRTAQNHLQNPTRNEYVRLQIKLQAVLR